MMLVCIKPVSREEQNGPGFHYVVRWCDHRRRTLHDQPATARGNASASGRHNEFEERRVPTNVTELVLGGLPVFVPYDVYVVSVNDIGPAVTTPRLAVVYTGEDGLQTCLSSTPQPEKKF